MCLYVFLYQQLGLFVIVYMYFGVSYMYHLSAHSVVSFHCVLPIFFLFADFLLIYYSALCILCISYVKYIHVYINQFGAH